MILSYHKMKVEIKVDRLKVFARHGVLPQERVVGNDFEVTVTACVDMPEEVLASDDLAGTVSYAGIVDVVKREMAEPSQLIEHVAWRIGRAVMRDHDAVESCQVTVAKLLPPIPSVEMKSASVTLAFH